MKHTRITHYLILLIASLFIPIASAKQKPPAPKYDQAELKKQYDAFLPSLKYIEVAKDFPKTIESLLSDDYNRQILAIKTLGATGKPYVIPWLVPFLDSEKKDIKIWAGSSISKVIQTWALQRRDPKIGEKVVLMPLKKDELNIKPLQWIALKMFNKNDDGNTHAYATVMTRYLEVKEFENELLKCLQSKHPAVSDKAKWALESLELNQKK